MNKRLGAQRDYDPQVTASFVPYALPHPHRYPFQMDLARVAGRDAVRAAEQDGRYTCYILGDVGGIVDPLPQRTVARAMCALGADGQRYDRHDRPCGGTLFAYIVGDIVYYNGEPAHYREQFYEPYRDYDRPIVAIPGNHDGGLGSDPTRASLDGFIANFCALEQHGPADFGRDRTPISQPNVYWTLEAPWLRVVGLYTNVPETGVVEEEQRRWFLEQMERPLDGRHLIVTLHQPVFSADRVHSGSRDMLDLIHEPAKRAGCKIVISGHAHNYPRFAYDGIIYLVAGGGGYFELHDLTPREFAGAQYPLVAHTRDHSFLHVTVTPDRLRLRAIAVPLSFDAHSSRPLVVDDLTIGQTVREFAAEY